MAPPNTRRGPPPDPPPTNLDYPDHEGNLSDCELPYDDPPGKIEEALLSTSESASQRILAAQTIFGSIANVLDLQCQSNNEHMHANDIRALNDLCEEFRAVAKRHFEVYNNSHRKGNTPSSYAQAASPNTHLPHRASTTIFDCNRVESRNVLSDDRLFLRLPENNQLRTLSGYALQSLLKSKLGSDGHLLANTLPTKTGFALCPTKGNSEFLAVKLSGINTLNGKPIERASPWKSYRITNVPRRYGTANDNLNISLEPVTTSSMSDAIAAAVGVPHILVTPSCDNDAQPDSPTTSWIVRFKENNIILPRPLYFFGIRTSWRILPSRTSVTQCTRCWLWHNNRRVLRYISKEPDAGLTFPKYDNPILEIYSDSDFAGDSSTAHSTSDSPIKLGSHIS
ncbi:hypothetical protein EPUL_003430 [Erysiphe pulchra]|uniref:Uncharacterized protein n=1 Tax=Erysiphe pulchra TaxID=225359 RepID=A0A2S4PMF9_9PEZI|nr:hypothetical protein EPUL_003430 [Erysiphe pulchra]